jgi:hypothetical protein
LLATVWAFLAWRPKSWPQAIVQAVAMGALFGAVQLWLGMSSSDDRRWFLAWWMPLWMATSMAGYAFWAWMGRRTGAPQESAPRR